ncbi:family 10 glycosylhydrolase [Alkaliphilus peptidifermentans]|nr:family 10 glycosylhydrolase [Alkaliphilus peptidifermentans]
MLAKNALVRIISIFIVFILMVSASPINIFAAAKPWDQYTQYLPGQTPIAKRHLRAAWISTVINLDWPSLEARSIENDEERIQRSKDELIEILDRSVEMNMNAVFFQVSPEGDALYKSNIVNWSRYLTGTFGKDPGFDPLAFAIEEAHKRNLELHAWFNPYRVSMYTNEAIVESLNIEKSVFKEHPEWIRTARSRFVVDPGIPDARDWVVGRVMEVVNNYDIDGIHFDDYFYYESYEGELDDKETFRKYNSSQYSNIGDWRRNNTYVLIKELSQKIQITKPWVKFGISPAGVWGNKKDGHTDGSNTNSSLTNYDQSFADTKRWVEEELIDYISPQIYFTFANSRVPYGEISDWWADVVKERNVHLYIGQALYKINDNNDQYFQGNDAVDEFDRQLKFNIMKPEIMGSIMFRFKNFNDAGKQQVVNGMKKNLWATKALVPVMPWKGGQAPDNPTQGKVDSTNQGIKLSWLDNDPNTTYYAVYRMNKGEKIDISSDGSGAYLIGTVRKEQNGLQEFIDKGTIDANKVIYAVTALDRLHNESRELIISTNQSKYFYDVGNQYSWAIDAIDSSYERGIVYGDGKGLFNPGKNTTRGDFILMVVRALELKAEFQDNFSDVPKGVYYYDAIGTARTLGIAKGDGATFNPNGNITREDMMVIMARTLEILDIELEEAGEESLDMYNDASLISDYARQAVASLTKSGLIQGSGDGVKPKHQATRAEIVVVLHRLLQSIDSI